VQADAGAGSQANTAAATVAAVAAVAAALLPQGPWGGRAVAWAGKRNMPAVAGNAHAAASCCCTPGPEPPGAGWRGSPMLCWR
jgi:hypothetical protein